MLTNVGGDMTIPGMKIKVFGKNHQTDEYDHAMVGSQLTKVGNDLTTVGSHITEVGNLLTSVGC